jgi:hypothetical protein
MSRIDCLLLDVLARDDFFLRFFIREDFFFFIGYSLFRRQRVHLFLHPMGSLVAIKTKAPLENKKMYGCSHGLPHWPAQRRVSRTDLFKSAHAKADVADSLPTEALF